MNGFDPIQDTFRVLAGGKVKGTQRPGEQFLNRRERLKNKLRSVGCNVIIPFITMSLVLALALLLVT